MSWASSCPGIPGKSLSQPQTRQRELGELGAGREKPGKLSTAAFVIVRRSVSPVFFSRHLSQGAAGAQLVDLLWREARLCEQRVGVFAGAAGGFGHLRWRATEAGSGGVLLDAVDLYERLACDVVWVTRGLLHRQHGCEARVGAFHDSAPLIPRS